MKKQSLFHRKFVPNFLFFSVFIHLRLVYVYFNKLMDFSILKIETKILMDNSMFFDNHSCG